MDRSRDRRGQAWTDTPPSLSTLLLGAGSGLTNRARQPQVPRSGAAGSPPGPVLVRLCGGRSGPTCWPLLLGGREGPQQKSRRTGSQPGRSPNPRGGPLRGRPRHPEPWAGLRQPTFDDVRIFQGQLPQQLVFAGGVDDAGRRVPVEAQGCSGWGRGARPREGQPRPLSEHPPAPATHRLTELRRREPDFRFRVVHTRRSVNKKRDRSFLPPTAFCGARGSIQAQRPTPLPTAPRGQPGPGRGGALPQLPRGRGRGGTRPRAPVGVEEQGEPWPEGMSRSVNKVGVGWGQAETLGHFLPLR